MSYIYDWKHGINKEELNECINIIKNGGIVIFPTDTVYGIGCNAFNEDTIKRIYEIKNRNYNKPINVLCSSIKDIENLALGLNTKEKEIINKYMPGDCTLIVNKKKEISDILTSGLNTVGVRIPNNNIALELIRKCEFPIATTSANISGESDNIEIEEILKEFASKVDVIINGGTSKIGIPSTIVRVDNEEIKILRQGRLKID
jgi:L-threonylcarbamoyladenylate synthase